MKLNLHDQSRALYCIDQAVGTTGTGLTGRVIDTKGYNGVEFLISYGAVTATAATVTITCLEGDATNALTSVADTYLAGTEAAAGLGQAVRTDYTGDKIVTRLGYKGLKRYVTIKEVPTATAAAQISVIALLHSPEIAATSNP